ncbi:sensor histidine kinase [Planococcus lenghuensis]|uniref:histidine kinase n=1 Tax=Planococcus lenghuensis TaxID=2213202 RepID=A0A1Q2L4J1_9BACL|nr:HAMP domain-containing sensor histidine kinase [Planococcus lenghuensis]AQQ55294.1 two-component sensor histidine kinase [Planococcus lenghuensis]
MNKLSLKIGLLFFVFLLISEALLFFVLYNNLAHERVDEIMDNLLARGNTHSSVLEDNFNESTLTHVGMMESASDFIVIITDTSGNVIVNSDPIEPEMAQLVAHTDYRSVPAEGGIIEDRWEEMPYIATDSPITIDGAHQGHVFMFANTSTVRNTINYLSSQFFIMGLFTVLGTIVTVLLLSRFITLPLIKMKKATEQLSTGINNIELDTERKDELGDLAKSITRLSFDLERLKNERNEFLASISHELRTPLTYIKGYTDILSREGLADTAKNEYISIIQQETEQLTGLIKNLFELAKVDRNQFVINKRPVNLTKLIHSVIDMTRPAFTEKNVNLQVTCDSSITLHIDPERFQQVLLNLVDNAKKTSASGDCVRIEAVQTEQAVTITVTDEGEGIPAEDLPYIFDRLYRVEKSRSRKNGGTGLGLSIAKEIVESHGGNIEIQSKVQEGTRIQIQLKRGVPDDQSSIN